VRPVTRTPPHHPSTGSASDRGRRRHLADALAVHEVPDGLGAVVADGIGDTADAAAAARIAADAAALVAARDGAVAALLTAGAAVRAAPTDGDAVMVVAAMRGGRCELAWVGDCRAYLWDGASIRLLTTDQTAAEAVRGAGGTPPRGWEHVVLETVARASARTVGRREVPPAFGRLALVSDGVHREVSAAEIATLLGRAPDCAAAARWLTDTALLTGGDNASATVIDLPVVPAVPRAAGNTDPRMPVVPAAEVAESA
jgi:hypothetical protein